MGCPDGGPLWTGSESMGWEIMGKSRLFAAFFVSLGENLCLFCQSWVGCDGGRIKSWDKMGILGITLLPLYVVVTRA